MLLMALNKALKLILLLLKITVMLLLLPLRKAKKQLKRKNQVKRNSPKRYQR
uniref:Uncharacterized protein n=1 Tax=Rhizophora mucronata TaxID=61149 RepID=A0A2P2NYX2_RHIMU